MKIGILTFHSAHNYGAVLQAYGMQKEIERLGHSATFINYYNRVLEDRNRYRRAVRTPKEFLASLAYKLLASKLKKRYERFDSFQREHLSLTKRYTTPEELEAEVEWDFDGVLCGSDQVWNYQQGLSPIYFFRFLDEAVPAIAYAPSFGKAFDAASAPTELGPWINRFQYLSGRDFWCRAHQSAHWAGCAAGA